MADNTEQPKETLIIPPNINRVKLYKNEGKQHTDRSTNKPKTKSTLQAAAAVCCMTSKLDRFYLLIPGTTAVIGLVPGYRPCLPSPFYFRVNHHPPKRMRHITKTKQTRHLPTKQDFLIKGRTEDEKIYVHVDGKDSQKRLRPALLSYIPGTRCVLMY